MKKSLLIMLMLLEASSYAISQCDSIRYVGAYNYITGDSIFLHKSVNVSNETIRTQFSFYIDELANETGSGDKKSLYINLNILDEKDTLMCTCSSVNKLFTLYSSPEATMYFSGNIGEDLFAEVKRNRFFGESVHYWFKFDSNNNIKKVRRVTLHGL